MKVLKKKDKEDLVGTAVQIAFEYPDWNCFHVHDMYECGSVRSYSEDDLADMTRRAAQWKSDGKNFSETYDLLMD